jgi:hypothetical protein
LGRAHAVVTVLLLVLAPSSVRAEPPEDAGHPEAAAGHHCLDQPRSSWLARQVLVGQFNPLGAESELRGGLCLPLVTAPGAMFAYTNVEAGVINRLAPGYTHLGGYLAVTPLSILQLRADLMGVYYFPFPYEATGYFPVSGPDADFRSAAFPKSAADSAGGWNLDLTGVLRLPIDVTPKLRVAVVSASGGEHYVIGGAAYYYNQRRETILPQRAWIVSNFTTAVADITVTDALHLLAGPYDAYRLSPSTGYAVNQVGVILGARWPSPRALLAAMRDLELFLRAGVYTAHAFREGEPTVLLALSSSYDLGGF